jgi:hypothetical protein
VGALEMVVRAKPRLAEAYPAGGRGAPGWGKARLRRTREAGLGLGLVKGDAKWTAIASSLLLR